MFDHVTLRVTDLAAGRSAFSAVLDELEIEQTVSTPSLTSIVSGGPASTLGLPTTGPPARVRVTQTITTRHI